MKKPNIENLRDSTVFVRAGDEGLALSGLHLSSLIFHPSSLITVRAS
jgi:hypothetical protein